MSDETLAEKILTAAPFGELERLPGHPHTRWMKTIQQDLKSNNFTVNEAIGVAQNRTLWRLMSVWCYSLLVVHVRKEKEC